MRLLARPSNSLLSRSRPVALALISSILGICVVLFLVPSAKRRIPIPDAVTDIVSSLPPLQDPSSSHSGKASARHPRLLHVLMHAPFVDVTLCKTITTALILGYPAPRVLNWDRELATGNDNVDRLAAISRYLDAQSAQSAERSDDLVLVVDGYNTWFQLRPEALIHRYLQANADASQRAETRAQPKGPGPAQQDVVFAAQKSCWPWASDDPTCLSVPPSTLPRDIYGPNTDEYKGHERFPYATFRQRYLNSGAYLGRLGSLKELMTRASQLAGMQRTAFDRLGDSWVSGDWTQRSDQVIFQRMFKQQEIAREQGNCSQWDMAREKCEFSVGLDYESRLTQAHAFAEGDMDWILHEWLGDNHTDPADTAEAQLETRDLLGFQRPFADLETGGPGGWDEVPLYTNKFTNIAPVLVNHNIHADNLLSINEQQWAKMWYQPHVAGMLDARASGGSSRRLAVTEIDGEEVEWFSAIQPDDHQNGAYTEDDTFIPWTDVCDQWKDDVLRAK